MSPFPGGVQDFKGPCCFLPPEMSLWAFSPVWDVTRVHPSLRRESRLWKVTRALDDGEAESVLPKETERTLLPAFWMKDTWRFFPAGLCASTESQGHASASSLQPHLSAITRGGSVLLPVFTNQECDKPVWRCPGTNFTLLIILDVSVFICSLTVLLVIASVILFSGCQVA